MSWVKVYELIQWWCYVVEAFHLKFISFDFVVFFLNFGASQFFPHEPLKSSHTQHLGSLACYLVARFRWLCFMFHNAHTESLRILPLSTLNITVWVQGYKNVKLERWPSSVPPGVQRGHLHLSSLTLSLFDSVLGNFDRDACENTPKWYDGARVSAHSWAEMLGAREPGNPQIHSLCWGEG